MWMTFVEPIANVMVLDWKCQRPAPIRATLAKRIFLDQARGGCQMYTVVINVETASLWPVASGQAVAIPINVEARFCCVTIVSNEGRKRTPMVMGCIELQHHVESYWAVNFFNPYPTAFPYGNGTVLHFYQQQESSTTKTVHKVINKGLKTYV